MSILYSWQNRNFREVHKKYTVGGGHHAAKADTLEEAKKAGEKIAKMEAYRGRWNYSVMSLEISVQRSLGSIFYSPTGWKMYVPIAGTGRRFSVIEAEIKKRHGVDPMRWTRR